MLVTAGALFALAVVIAIGPDGPARLWLDGGGSTVNLKARDGTTLGGTLPDGPAGLLPGSSTSGLTGAVTLGSPIAATERPGAVQLRANTRVRRRAAARTPSASRPNTPSPASTPSQPVSQSTATTAAPVASAAPGSTVVKSRGRGTSPSTTEVPKQRVPKSATPAPTAEPPASAAPGPAPRSAATPAPATQMRPVHGGSQPSTVVGAADGVLHRVVPTHP